MDPSKVNILLVDDKPDKLLALEAVLEDLGQVVVRAYSGREALRCVMNQEFAVILLDVNMPGMDGFETASLIRQRKSTEHVPIIFVTAYGDDDHRSRGYSLGAVDYIQTPIVPEVLKTKVAVFVELHRKTEQVRRQAQWLRQRANQLHKLTEGCLAINSAPSLERILSVAVETTREILGAPLASAVLMRDGNWAGATLVSSASEPYERWRLQRPRKDDLRGLVCRTNKPIRLSADELAAQSLWSESNSESSRPESGGWIAAPLVTRDGHNMGLIETCAAAAASFSSDDEALVVQLAQSTSVAVINAIFAEERETNRIKDEFLSTLSHELRTPLSAILGWTQLLRYKSADGAVGHGLAVIERNARAQLKLVEDLLDVSRVTRGTLKLNLHPVELAPIVESAIDAIRPVAADKSLQIAWNCDVARSPLIGDADRLSQVVANLLANAVKFTPAGGKIDVYLDRVDWQWRIRVADTGIGIGPAFLPHVFDRFRQADSTSTRSHAGLGIGLAIVRHIVELHGGSVQAGSPGENMGTTMTVLLPAAPIELTGSQASAQSQGAVEGGPEDVQLNGLRILVVDDEADAREVICRILQRAGATAIEAASAAQAMRLIELEPPDILVSDIAMPDADGYELIRRVRSMPGTRGNIPAVAITAYARQEDRVKSMECGFHRHIAKPIVPAELLLEIQRLATLSSVNDSAVEPTAMASLRPADPA